MGTAEEKILSYLQNHDEIADSGKFAEEQGIDHNDVVNVVKSLHGFRYVDAQDIKKETWVLTGEGSKYAAEGSPEVQLFLAVPPQGSISKEELQKKLDPAVFKIGCSQAGKNKWVEMGKQVSRKIGIFGLQVLWHFLHLVITLWYLGVGIANVLESSLISSGLLKRYKAFDLGKLRYLAIVIESEDALDTAKIIQLVRWLAAIGVKHICLYDMEGVLKKSKDYIIEKLNNAILLEGAAGRDLLLNQEHMTLEFISISDGKEAVAKAANFLFVEHFELANTSAEQEDRILTEFHMTEALRAVGCGGPEPDLLLVYGPARCHLGFPAWRIRYTEIVHMGTLKSLKYGALVKAIHKFTLVRQNYGK